jgi:hypothetical protein
MNRFRDIWFRGIWRFRWRWHRWHLGIRYAVGRLTSDQAHELRYECQQISGCYPLETIDMESTLEAFRACYGDHPELPRLVRDACARVGDKWSSSGHVGDAAQGWAFDLVREYAEAEGITLPTGEGGDLKALGQNAI